MSEGEKLLPDVPQDVRDPDDIVERLTDHGLYSKQERMKLFIEARNEIKRLRLEITKAEIIAIGDTVTTLRKMGHGECSEERAEAKRPHWAEEISDEIRMLRTYNAHLLRALARIALSDAQCGEDAMQMRNIATAILHPDKAGIYDESLPTYVRPFHGSECSSYPNCNGGCGLGCTKEMERSEVMVQVPKAALDWLFGIAPDAEGKEFGECETSATPVSAIFPRPKYWWRSKFRSMIPALSAGAGAGAGKPL